MSEMYAQLKNEMCILKEIKIISQLQPLFLATLDVSVHFPD